MLTCHLRRSVAFNWEQFHKQWSWTQSVSCIRIQWNLYTVMSLGKCYKKHKFHHLPGTVCERPTTCLERPQNLLVAKFIQVWLYYTFNGPLHLPGASELSHWCDTSLYGWTLVKWRAGIIGSIFPVQLCRPQGPFQWYWFMINGIFIMKMPSLYWKLTYLCTPKNLQYTKSWLEDPRNKCLMK